jgi:bifunctional N-acetylglucosamine-1-phosphate-uridyltransferase/glucosamine-1-phosphate-acetyltransferase GlmU-like protein
MNVNISTYAQRFSVLFPSIANENPWTVVQAIQETLTDRMKKLGPDYIIKGLTAIHKSATIEEHVILKGPVIVSANCFIGAHAYLRAGVFLDEKVVVGPACEIKSSLILSHSALAHFNFVGDSVIGSYVNMEAGSVIANHYNERDPDQKNISVYFEGKCQPTGTIKFGALVGDHSKIGANAVLSPGTLLMPRSIVKRLELVEQCRK